jgi:hypothetical protein
MPDVPEPDAPAALTVDDGDDVASLAPDQLRGGVRGRAIMWRNRT